MAFIPWIFSEWWERLDEPHLLPAQNFAVQVEPSPEKLETTIRSAPERLQNHPWQLFRNFYFPRRVTAMEGQEGQGCSVVKTDKDKFHVALDIQQFRPDEIKVKVINNYVLVEGKHDEKPDEHGSITRHFIRKYLVPEQCDIDKVTSSLSSDGILTLNAPRKQEIRSSEREIEIELTGKPAVIEKGTSVDQDKEKLGSEKIEDTKMTTEDQMKALDEERTSVEDTEKLKSEEIEDKMTAEDLVEKKTSVEDTEKLRWKKIEDTTPTMDRVKTAAEEKASVKDTEKLRSERIEDLTTAKNRVKAAVEEGTSVEDTEKLRWKKIEDTTPTMDRVKTAAEEKPSVKDTEKLIKSEKIGSRTIARDQIKAYEEETPKSTKDLKSKVNV